MTTTQTLVFRKLVRDHMRAPPVVLAPATSCAETVRRMSEARASAAAVVGPRGTIRGILTEQDVTRKICCHPAADGLVEGVMTSPVLTVSADDHLYKAIGFMRRHNLRHMPVTDADGVLVGMLFLHEALAVATGQITDAIDNLTHETTREGLHNVKAAQVQLAADLFADNVPAPEIQALISDINNDIHRRVLTLELQAMADAYWGAPPVSFACIVMGSGGRGESYLFPDQDNGFVIADYPDDQHTAIDAFFIELADRMVKLLDELSFPLCNGGVMATNPVWRKTLPQWKTQVQGWVRRRNEVMLQLCDVFFDFRCVYGDEALAEDLRTHVNWLARANPSFLREMFGVQAEHRAGIGLFGRLLTERNKGKHKGKLNLKHAGTLPLAEGVRLLALRRGIAATSTLARIDALAELGDLDADDADYLRGAFGLITGLQLRQQIRDYERGKPVGNFVKPKALSEREKKMLKDALKAINEFRDRVRSDLTGEVF